MAKISHDIMLHNPENFVTITNTDADWLKAITSESFTRPAVELKFLNISSKTFEELVVCSINYDDAEEELSDLFSREDYKIPDNDLIQMTLGKLPGWRLIGVDFSPQYGMSAYCVNERQPTPTSSTNSGYNNLLRGVEFHFIEKPRLEVEIGVDYDDGQLPRRYICVVDSSSEALGISTEITEYLGKRKIRKLQFSEHEYRQDASGLTHICHITEY